MFKAALGPKMISPTTKLLFECFKHINQPKTFKTRRSTKLKGQERRALFRKATKWPTLTFWLFKDSLQVIQ